MHSRAVTHSFRRAVPTRNATPPFPSFPILVHPIPSRHLPSSLPFPFASLRSPTPLLSPPHLLRSTTTYFHPLLPRLSDPSTATLSTPRPLYHDEALCL